MNRILDAVLTFVFTLSIGFMGCLITLEYMDLRERVEALEQQGSQDFEIMILPGEPTLPPPKPAVCPQPQRKSC